MDDIVDIAVYWQQGSQGGVCWLERCALEPAEGRTGFLPRHGACTAYLSMRKLLGWFSRWPPQTSTLNVLLSDFSGPDLTIQI